MDEIREACQTYINDSILPELNDRFVAALNEAGISGGNARLEPDPDDDGQSLLLWYPSVTALGNDYIRRAIKIESGAKSALDPHSLIIIKPYVDDQLPDLNLSVANVTTVDPRRYLMGQDCYPTWSSSLVGSSARAQGRWAARLAPLLRCLSPALVKKLSTTQRW